MGNRQIQVVVLFSQSHGWAAVSKQKGLRGLGLMVLGSMVDALNRPC